MEMLRRRQKRIFFLTICTFVLCIFILSFWIPTGSSRSRDFKVTFPNVYFKEKPVKKILLWTTFFQSRWKFDRYKCLETCPVKCEVTDDKTDLPHADAVDFHLTDVWTKQWRINTKSVAQFPEYRTPDQVWIISNMEPPPHLFGNIEILNGLFNMTKWYRLDSDVVMYYGRPYRLNELEGKHATAKLTGRNFFKEKTRGVSLRISNCFDPGQRYRLIGQLEKYMPIDKYGKCYGNPCGNPTDPYDKSCSEIMDSYKFYFAFENDNCKDYVTEKYWATLARDTVPIVNWKNIDPNTVIPNSYINIYDFDSMKSAAEYIMKVGANETLYNSYFEYKKLYKNHVGTCDVCRLCEALHDKHRPAQVYTDLNGWVRDDLCEKVGVSDALNTKDNYSNNTSDDDGDNNNDDNYM